MLLKKKTTGWELELFKSILNNLKHGNLYTSDRKSAGSVILEINNINILMNRIIPIFSKGMLTKKSLDFEDWSMIVKITYYGYHTLDEGKELIYLIKSNMNNFRLNPDFLTNYDKNKALIEQKLNYLLSLPTPYEVKQGILFLRGTDKLVSKFFKIKVEDTNGKVQYFSSISECSLNLNIPSKIIKNCLLSGLHHKNYTIKFDTIIE